MKRIAALSLGQLLGFHPAMYHHGGSRRYRLRHRDARVERSLLQAEHVVEPVLPAAIDVELLHRERPLVGVEPIHTIRRLAGHARHGSDWCAEMFEVHRDQAKRIAFDVSTSAFATRQ
jgi:hypothetical protein